jgi:hypothetical protein
MSALLASQRRNFINFLGPDLKLSTSSGAQQHISSNIFALFRITELFRDSRTSKPCLGSTQYAPHRRFTPRPLNQPRRPSYPRHHDSLTFDTLKGFHAPTYYQGKSRPSVKLLHDGPNHCIVACVSSEPLRDPCLLSPRECSALASCSPN